MAGLDRRVVLGGLAATALVPSALALPHNCFDRCGDGCKGLCRNGYGSHFDRLPGLKLAWEVTLGLTPQGMYRALTSNFGNFHIPTVNVLSSTASGACLFRNIALNSSSALRASASE